MNIHRAWVTQLPELDDRRRETSGALDTVTQSALGQYLTPDAIAEFMASLFLPMTGEPRILDAGAGIGSLSAALISHLYEQNEQRVQLTCVERDGLMLSGLEETLAQLGSKSLNLASEIVPEDYIEASCFFDRLSGFTHAILNPPYKKLPRKSVQATELRRAGVYVPNLYAAFLMLAARQLVPNGQMVAIVPRSFCNGPYFKAFRQAFFKLMSLTRVHVFESRRSAFSDDKVLQENIIFHAVKRTGQGPVEVSVSPTADFEVRDDRQQPLDMMSHTLDAGELFLPGDDSLIIHLPTSRADRHAARTIQAMPETLASLGVSISTGPVVDFRHKAALYKYNGPSRVPLIYAQNLRGRALKWPLDGRKAQYIEVTDATRPYLMPTSGNYVVTKRFSSKEETKRIVATVAVPPEGHRLCGWENHLNVFHANKAGLNTRLANGLSAYLNSTLVDRYFRVFNGHTQVNATDLRFLRYPSLDTLEAIGGTLDANASSQTDIDAAVEAALCRQDEVA